MEYIYAALLLHKAGHAINEGNVKNVLTAAHVKVDDARVKALVAALEGVNINEAIEKAAMPVMAAMPAAAEAKPEEKKAEKKEEKKDMEQAAAGLGALFG